MLEFNNDSLDYDEIQLKLSASTQKIHLERIIFKEATKPDQEMSYFKYKPLNAGYRPGMPLKQIKNIKNVNNEHSVKDIPKPPVTLYPVEKIENDWKEIRKIGPGIGKNFRFGRQEDAHEFLRYVIEGIQKSDYAGRPNLDKLSKETTVANAIFGGYLRSQVKCLHCQYESNTFDPMMDMNLDIKECTNVVQALQRSVRADRLDGDNKYFCDRCRTKRTAQKKGTIHKEPNVLTLQLKRFDFSKMFGGKISKDVAFPDELNIRPYMSHPRGDDVMYKLYGVLVHSGYSCNSGHYYCYVRAPNGMWYEMNDNRVSQVGAQTVKNAQAYLLFYVKKTVKTTAGTAKNSSVVRSNLKVPMTSTKQNGGSPSTMQTAGLKHLADPFGISVPRKPEPKIVWKNSQQNNNGGTKAEKLLKQKAIKLSEYSSPNRTQNPPNNANTHKKQVATDSNSGPNLPAEKPHHNKKLDSNVVPKCNTKLNSLQRLSVSYGGDTDSPSSSAAPSPVLTEKDTETSVPMMKSETLSDVTVAKTSLPTRKENEIQTKDSPIRIKLNHGKVYNGASKFSVWSPLTKASLHPRVIINRLSDTGQPTEKTAKINTSSTPTKPDVTEAAKSVSFSRRTRTDSMNSEASSVASMSSQSGDWDISDKQNGDTTGKSFPARRHAGWKVCSNISSTFNGSLLNIAEQKASLKNQRANEETLPNTHDDQIKLRNGESRKRKHSCTGDKSFEHSVSVNLNVHVEIGRHDDSGSPKKKRKKKKKRKEKEKEGSKALSSHHEALESSLLRCSSDLEYESPDKVKKSKKKKRKKKKKKKHKRKHSSSDDDDDDDDTAKIDDGVMMAKDSNDVEECLQNHKKTPWKDDVKGKLKNSSEYSSSSKGVNKSSTSDRDARLIETRMPKHRHSYSSHRSSRQDDVTHQKHPSKEERTHERENKHDAKRRNSVPTHMWDEPRKNVTTWDGSVKSGTVDFLLSGGTKVSSWSGETVNSDVYTVKNRDEKERHQDDYDEDYDRGKQKKIKARHHDSDHDEKYSDRNPKNPFQHLQDYRNFSKDSTATHRSPTKYHHAKHRHGKSRTR